MSANRIPESVERLILESIDSVELLRVLMLLFDQPERAWTVAEINRELRSSESSIAKRLSDLYSRRLLKRPETESHCYVPYSEETAQAVRALAECHRLMPYRVIELIYSRPTDALRAFAAAFKIKKED